MDFQLQLMQWGDGPEEAEDQQTAAKLPKLHLPSPQYSMSTLPLFASQNNSTTAVSSVNLPGTGSCFSSAQWQELELQALIFRHMVAGADVPCELLHIVKKSLVGSPYHVSNPIYQSYPHYQSPLVLSGYWRKAAMDPEPGRCRRTDGKKWRCSRDVVAGHRYCDRHVHRGKYRSRKPVEIPTAPAAANGGDEALKTNHCRTQFSLSQTPTNLLHLRPRLFESVADPPNDGERTLRPFFDDWRRPHGSAAHSSGTNLSISNVPSSDFSLKLGTTVTGDDDVDTGAARIADRAQMMSWGMGPVGGPLAEMLRSSTTESFPTSILHHRHTRGSEAGYDIGST